MNTQQSKFILSPYLNYLNEQVQIAHKKSNVYFKYNKILNEYYEKISNFENIQKKKLISDKINFLMKKRTSFYWAVTSPNFMRATTKHIKALETYAQMYFK